MKTMLDWRKSTQNRRQEPTLGFTLVELIVTLVILAIVAAIAVPSFLGFIDDSKAKECEATRETLAVKIASARLASDVDGEGTEGAGFDVEEYIKSSGMKCPSGGHYRYSPAGDAISCDVPGHDGISPLKNPGSGGVTVKDLSSAETQPETAPTETAPPYEPVIGVSASPDVLDLKVGGTGKITVNVAADGSPASADSISWSSGNGAVAEVSNGTVTGKSAGSCVVTCTVTVKGQSYMASTTVNVSDYTVELTASPNPLILNTGENASLTVAASVDGGNVTPGSVSWQCIDGDAATVTADGSVYGNQAGTCTARCTAVIPTPAGEVTRTADVTITVNEKQKNGSLFLSEYSLILDQNTHKNIVATLTGDYKEIEVEVTPADLVSYNYYNNSQIQVWSNGKAGKCTLTVRAKDNPDVQAQCEIETFIRPYNLSVQSETMTVGETTKIKVGYNPENATYRALTYQVADETVATISEDGTITAQKAGQTTIKCSCPQPAGYPDPSPVDAAITVQPVQPKYVTGVTVTLEGDPNMYPGDVRTVTATIEPSDADCQAVEWSVSNPDVVEIIEKTDTTATIRALKMDWGSVDITATTKVARPEGGEDIDTGQVSVKVTDLYPSAAHLEPDPVTLYINSSDPEKPDSQVLNVVVDEPAGRNQEDFTIVSYYSASSDENGLEIKTNADARSWTVTGKKAGQYKVYVQINGIDRNLEATVNVIDENSQEQGGSSGQVVLSPKTAQISAYNGYAGLQATFNGDQQKIKSWDWSVDPAGFVNVEGWSGGCNVRSTQNQGMGNCTVTVTVVMQDGSSVSDSCEVTVYRNDVENAHLEPAELNLYLDDPDLKSQNFTVVEDGIDSKSAYFKPRIIWAGGGNVSVKYDNSPVVTVTGQTEGENTVQVKVAKIGGGEVILEGKVNVYAAKPKESDDNSFMIDGNKFKGTSWEAFKKAVIDYYEQTGKDYKVHDPSNGDSPIFYDEIPGEDGKIEKVLYVITGTNKDYGAAKVQKYDSFEDFIKNGRDDGGKNFVKVNLDTIETVDESTDGEKSYEEGSVVRVKNAQGGYDYYVAYSTSASKTKVKFLFNPSNDPKENGWSKLQFVE